MNTSIAGISTEIHQSIDAVTRRAWLQLMRDTGAQPFCSHPGWAAAICRGLRQRPYAITARLQGRPEKKDNHRIEGVLPLSFVKSVLFGRFLVSLPYINSAGVVARTDEAATALIERAVELADRLDVRYLELRHERRRGHPALKQELTDKVHMRLSLPRTAAELWAAFKPKVRNQIRKGEKSGLSIHWGSQQLLPDFYAVFSRNMRDLGTPVFSRRLFARILEELPEEAELCVVRLGSRPVAAAVLVHGPRSSEVPSASSLRRFNRTNANMLMYWHLLQRSIDRGQASFDFGRSSPRSGTYQFKKQWGAQPSPAVWQYYVRRGDVGDMRIETGKYNRKIAVWQRLPVPLTRVLGPMIIRGVP